MKTIDPAHKLQEQMKDFLDKNPGLKEALRVFDISFEQYRRAEEGSYRFYTSTTTAPIDLDASGAKNERR
ncbi:MAG: hypothetical protein D4R93_03405 [Deltaproteobacteria bacterium]|nr:MAG: hypothetical protein D4R93_03405 [Deltaproteobacteria bacterium]